MHKIKIKTEWDLSELLDNPSDPRIETELKDYEKAVDLFVKKYSQDKSWINNSKALKKALDGYEQISNSYGKVVYYFVLLTQKYQNDTEIKAKYNKILDKTKRINIKTYFFSLELAKISLKQQTIFLKSQDLIDYKHYLERKFLNGKYLLTEPEEKILTLKSSVSYENWKKMVSSLLSKEERFILIKGKKEKKNFSEISSLMNDKNKKIRDAAALQFNDILNKYVEISEHEFNSVLQDKKINDELRNRERPDLSRYIDDDIDSEIADILSDSVSSKFNLSSRYYKLKAKLLKQKQLEYHERNVAYGETLKKYTISDSIDLVGKTFKKLDPEFEKIFNKFFVLGRVDVYPKKGKRIGAFCIHQSPSLPIYIMLNHNDKLDNVLTIAHEFGHAINDELSNVQNSLTNNIPTSVAEVASTFMEDFVLQELLKDANDELRLALMMQKLNDDVSTIFRQIAGYRFEQGLHAEFREKGYLSKDEIGKLFLKHMNSYMGPFVKQSKGSENWWVYWPHLRNYFYNYTYASGLLISKAMQAKYKKDPKFINKVKEFLSAGNSASPKDIFMRMGIDITKKEFWLEGLKEIEKLLNDTEKLAKKLKKI